MGTVAIEHFPDEETLAAAVAAGWCTALAGAGRRGVRHTVALSGGRVSMRVFAAMAGLAASGRLDPAPGRFFWADERCVPPDHPDSNYLMAKTQLLDPLGIAAGSIYRVQGELDPCQAAAAASIALHQATGTSKPAIPVLDLVLLGMGEDGHVASLFPGDDAALLDETSVFRAVFDSPKPPPRRVTLGLGPLIAAREVWVVVAGQAKQDSLRDSLSPAGRTPLARLIQRRCRTRILSCIPV